MYVKSNPTGTRFTGYFRDMHGTRKSAGTFNTRAEAEAAATEAEQHGAREYPPAMPIAEWSERYLTETPRLSDRTKVSYRSLYRRLINPALGQRLVGELTRREVRAFLDGLLRQGHGAATVNQCKCALASMYRALVEDDFLDSSPTDRIPAYKGASHEPEVVEVDEYQKIREQLPTEGAKLFADFLISLGLRFGEATECRAGDLSSRRGVVTLSAQRVASDIGAKHNDGSRFKVLAGTKGKWNARKTRTVVVPDLFAARLFQWITANALKPGDLLFPLRLVEVPDDETVVLGEPWSDGPRNFLHGTLYSYQTGGCHCDLCMVAMRVHYRRYRSRAARLKPEPSGNITGHLPRDTWRRIWRRAIKDSGIGWYPRTHDLRHACASLNLEAGVSLQDVKDLLGHGRISTTERYLHVVNRNKKRATNTFDAIWASDGSPTP